ncbi:MAG: hypothetical protein SRB2_01935 [Desulfobacteraceae bacterium Eth-SRB2]|nr:MAG: hypothetical protein SRB2_01935 [Desulfobacteraceae bacterium Eth-SRB2]
MDSMSSEHKGIYQERLGSGLQIAPCNGCALVATGWVKSLKSIRTYVGGKTEDS